MNIVNNSSLRPPSRFEEAFAAWAYCDRKYEETPVDELDEEEGNRAYNAKSSAEDQLIVAPAQTIADVLTKLEVLFQHRHICLSGEDLDEVISDLRRIAGNPASRTFNAGVWLDWFEKKGGGWVDRNGEIVLLVPDHDSVKDLLWTLDTRDGRPSVYALIRERTAAKQLEEVTDA